MTHPPKSPCGSIEVNVAASTCQTKRKAILLLRSADHTEACDSTVGTLTCKPAIKQAPLIDWKSAAFSSAEAMGDQTFRGRRLHEFIELEALAGRWHKRHQVEGLRAARKAAVTFRTSPYQLRQSENASNSTAILALLPPALRSLCSPWILAEISASVQPKAPSFGTLRLLPQSTSSSPRPGQRLVAWSLELRPSASTSQGFEGLRKAPLALGVRSWFPP